MRKHLCSSDFQTELSPVDDAIIAGMLGSCEQHSAHPPLRVQGLSGEVSSDASPYVGRGTQWRTQAVFE